MPERIVCAQRENEREWKKDAIRNEFNNGDVDHFSNLTKEQLRLTHNTIDLLQGKIIYKLLVAGARINSHSFYMMNIIVGTVKQPDGNEEHHWYHWSREKKRHLTMVKFEIIQQIYQYHCLMILVNFLKPQIKRTFAGIGAFCSDAIVKLKKESHFFD